MGFKSQKLPIVDVRRAMQGKDCLAFKAKKRKTQGRTNKYAIG
jgi:hypothetical protein